MMLVNKKSIKPAIPNKTPVHHRCLKEKCGKTLEKAHKRGKRIRAAHGAINQPEVHLPGPDAPGHIRIDGAACEHAAHIEPDIE